MKTELSPEKLALLVLRSRKKKRSEAAGVAGEDGDGRESARRTSGRIPRRTDEGPAALSYAQQRLWLLDRLEGEGGTAYNMPFPARLTGDLDAALRACRSRHGAVSPSACSRRSPSGRSTSSAAP
jgi:hypothetical protein